MPAGVTVDVDLINAELTRRQGGYGRGGRMKIERDTVTVLSGVRRGVTIGSPIAMQIVNRDSRIDDAPPIHRPRPGHADLAGSLKWLTTDCRETLERASARETAARVAAGALARCLLREFGIDVCGYVVQIGTVVAAHTVAIRTPTGREGPTRGHRGETGRSLPLPVLIEATGPQDDLGALRAARDSNEAYCPDAAAAEKMIAAIRKAKEDKDTLGGVVEVRVEGHPPGLGSCMRWQDKLDGRLMQAVGSVQAIKGVEVGAGFAAARLPGSRVHDPIDYDPALHETACLGFTRRSNNAGGLEGGMTNGQPIVLRAAMKPISTLLQGMDSVNLVTKQPERSDHERSDVCSVPACSVVVENVVAFEVARVFLEKFGGDTLPEVRAAYHYFADAVRSLGSVATT
jgi:chorismate synthase